MKLFLSWSGNESRQLASIFKEWLPNVLQYTQPYMSANDISLGEMWNISIRSNLEESAFGLVFVTPSNINAPWINYEAGALAKTLDSKVVPILYRADVTILNQGPLKQFQSAKKLDRDDVHKLLKSINESNENGKLDETRLDKAFDIWWPYLDEKISNITVDESSSSETEPTEKELLSVIYSKMVEQEKLLKSNRIKEKEANFPMELVRDVRKGQKMLKQCLSKLEGGPYPDDFFNEIVEVIDSLDRALFFLGDRRHSISRQLELFKNIAE